MSANKIFISYSHINAEIAFAVCKELEANNYSCWIAPRDIPGGSTYGDLIEENIRTCSLFILILSKEASASQWCRAECNIAFSEEKMLLAYLIDDIQVTGELRLLLSGFHQIDAFNNPIGNIQNLVRSVASILPTPSDFVDLPDFTFEPVATCDKNEQQSVKILEKIAYSFLFGDRDHEKNIKKAISYFLKAAKMGSLISYTYLGRIYTEWDGVEPNPKIGFKYTKYAADHGECHALHNLACLYFTGKFVEVDIEKALSLFKKAANAGDIESLNSIGFVYDFYEDYETAFKYFLLAEEKGSVNCFYNLGYYHYYGRGTNRDIDKSLFYLNKAASIGNSDAKKLLLQIKSKNATEQ